MRLVDHRALASVAVVFGSLRLGEGLAAEITGRGGGGGGSSAPFDEHIVVVGWSDGRGGHGSSTLYLDGPEVELAGGASLDGAAGLGGAPVAPRVSWRSRKHGGMRVSGDEARACSPASEPAATRRALGCTSLRPHLRRGCRCSWPVSSSRPT